jgi:hypothetical protein
MITDFCMSLSRKKEDKVNGTGRFHIMKNRYGMDGLTFGVTANTNTGHFDVFDYNTDFEEEKLAPNTQSNPLDKTDKFEKQKLSAAYQLFTTQG